MVGLVVHLGFTCLEEANHTAGEDTIEGATTAEVNHSMTVVGVSLTSSTEVAIAAEVLVLTNFVIVVVVLATVAEVVVTSSFRAAEVATHTATVVAIHTATVVAMHTATVVAMHNATVVAMHTEGVRHTLATRAAHIPSSPISSTEFKRKPIQTSSWRCCCHKFPSAAQVVSSVKVLLVHSTSVANSYCVLP